MAELIKRTVEYKTYSEEEADALIEKIKLDPDKEGYIIKQYQKTLKEKKSKGEVVDAWWIVKVSQEF